MALEFDGVNERVDFPNTESFIGSDHTIALRFQRSSTDVLEYLFLIENGATNLALTLWISDAGGGSPRLTFSCSGSSFLSCSTSALTLNVDEWYDLILSWDGTTSASGVTMYLNGSLQTFNIAENGASLIAQDGNWVIAGKPSANDRNFTGRLADYGVWPVILDSGERALFNAGLPPAYVRAVEDDIIFDVRFVEGSTLDAVSSVEGTEIGTPVEFPQPNHVIAGTQSSPIPVQASTATNDSEETDDRNGAITTTSPIPIQAGTLTNEADLGPGITVIGSFEGGSIDPASCTIGGTSINPTVTLVTYSGIAGIVRHCYARVEGLTGKTLEATFDSDPMSFDFTAGQPFWWRPTGGGWYHGVGGWQEFESTVVTAGVMVATQTTPFTDDSIDIAEQPFINPSELAAFFAERIANSSYVTSPVSGEPTTGRFNILVATTGYNSAVIPELYQHVIRVGTGPRVILVEIRQHPNEGIGELAATKMISDLTDESASSIAHLERYSYYFFQGNPQGCYGGSQDAATFDAANPTLNCNRDWDGTSELDCVDAVKDFISSEIGEGNIVFGIDCHNRLSGTTGQESAWFFVDTRPLVQSFFDRFNTAYSGTDFVEFAGSGDTSIWANHFYDVFDIPCLTMEQAYGTDPTYEAYEECGSATIIALKAMDDAEEFGEWREVIITQIAPISIQSINTENDSPIVISDKFWTVIPKRLGRRK